MTRLAILALAGLLGACSKPADRPVVVRPMPSAALTLPCVDPVLISTPEQATDNDIALERVRVAEAYVNCRQRQADLARWVKEQ